LSSSSGGISQISQQFNSSWVARSLSAVRSSRRRNISRVITTPARYFEHASQNTGPSSSSPNNSFIPNLTVAYQRQSSLQYAQQPDRSSASVPEPPSTSTSSSTQQQQQQQQRILENVADDPSLANPLQRLNRLGTAWLGAIVELDGVLLSNKEADQRTAWLMAAEELGKTPPLKFQLDRAVNARNDVAVSEIFHWAREPSAVRRMSEVKENIFRNLQADKVDVLQPGMVEFLNTLHEADAPVCVASTRPRADVQSALAAAGVEHLSEHLVAAEDFYDRLDLYNYASTLIERPPVRCVVFGTSNAHIEGAHDAGMKCVVVPGPCQPTYELGSADLVLRDVSRLSFVNLKNLFANEQGVEPQTQLEEDESVDAISF